VTGYEVGIGLAGGLAPRRYRDLAVTAEAAGMDAITVFGDLMFQPPALVLLDMALVTDRIRLGVAAYNPWTQHPVEIAGQLATLDAASHGRAFYGLVRGAWLDRLGLAQRRPLAAITDTVAIVRAVLAGDDTGYEGPVYRLAPGTRRHYDVHRTDVPLLIGSWSPRLAALAGRIADEVQAGGSANPAMVPRLRTLAAGGGPPSSVAICLNAVTVVDEDGDAARAAARTAAAPYFDVVAGLDPTVTLDPELAQRIRTLCRAGDHEAAGRLIPAGLLRRFAFAGTPAEVAEQAAEILRAGASRVEFDTPFGLTEDRGLRLLCEAVLPRIRAATA
jgi:5,10-methylenetetrahydromethanopterin reductase